MKHLVALPLLMFACAAAAAPPAASSTNAAMRASVEAARAGDEAARASEESAKEAADAQKLAELQTRMNDLAQRMAELSVQIGDRASASALRYLADGKRGMLGVALEDDSAGLRVAALTPGGPAERAGLREGDVVTAINGTSVGSGGDGVLADAMVAGKPVTLTVLRDGKTLKFSVTPERFQSADWQALARTAQVAAQQSLAKVDSPEFRRRIERNVEEAMKQTAKARAEMAAHWGDHFNWNGRWFAPWWGLNLAPLNPQLGRYFGTDTGALVLSNDAKRYPGLEAGDVITAVGGHAVAGPEDVMRALGGTPENRPVQLAVRRHGKSLTVDFKVPPIRTLMPPLLPDPDPNPSFNPDPDPNPDRNPDPNPFPSDVPASSTHPATPQRQ